MNAVKSCPHVMHQSLAGQVDRCKASGFPSRVLLAVGESLGQKMNKKLAAKSGSSAEEGRNKFEVIPYFHKTSHGMKNMVSTWPSLLPANFLACAPKSLVGRGKLALAKLTTRRGSLRAQWGWFILSRCIVEKFTLGKLAGA